MQVGEIGYLPELVYVRPEVGWFAVLNLVADVGIAPA